jgi:hypothetical protein
MSWTPVAGGKLSKLPEIMRLLKAGSWTSWFFRQDLELDQLQIECKNQKPLRKLEQCCGSVSRISKIIKRRCEIVLYFLHFLKIEITCYWLVLAHKKSETKIVRKRIFLKMP